MYKNLVSFANKHAEYIIAMLHYFSNFKEKSVLVSFVERTIFALEQLCSPNEFIQKDTPREKNSNPDSACSNQFRFFPFKRAVNTWMFRKSSSPGLEFLNSQQ